MDHHGPSGLWLLAALDHLPAQASVVGLVGRFARHARSAPSGTRGHKALAAGWLGGSTTHRVCRGARLQRDPRSSSTPTPSIDTGLDGVLGLHPGWGFGRGWTRSAEYINWPLLLHRPVLSVRTTRPRSNPQVPPDNAWLAFPAHLHSEE